jgi:hypothetical protein
MQAQENCQSLYSQAIVVHPSHARCTRSVLAAL